MQLITGLIILAVGILQIILFFKIWGMCNNVAKLTDKFCNNPANGVVNKRIPSPDKVDISSPLSAGQRVQRLSDGMVMIIDRTDGINFACVSTRDRSWLGSYSRSQITPYTDKQRI